MKLETNTELILMLHQRLFQIKREDTNTVTENLEGSQMASAQEKTPTSLINLAALNRAKTIS